MRVGHGLQRMTVRSWLLASLVLAFLNPVNASAEPPADEWALVSPPEIYGTARVGESLGANQGYWQPSPQSVSFAWLRDGSEIVEADRANYTVQPEDTGHMISVRVTVARSDLGQRTATTEQLGPVNDDKALLGPSTSPVGLPYPGEVIDATPGVWVDSNYEPVDDVTFGYEWIRALPNVDNSEEPIADQTGRYYTVRTEDLGWMIYAKITATKPGYYSFPQWRNTGAVVVRITNTAAPMTTGDTHVGSTLAGLTGTWTPEIGVDSFAHSYVWLRDNNQIVGATSQSYRLTPLDAGHRITLRVTGTAHGYYTRSLTASSQSTDFVRHRSVVTLSGTRGKRKATLTVRVKAPTTPGTVKFWDGTRLVRGPVRLVKGTATVKLTKLKKGYHTFTVRYPTQTSVDGGSAKIRLKIK